MSVVAQAVKDVIWSHAAVSTAIVVIHVYLILLNVAVPLALLVMNATVVHELRRQDTAAHSHGRQQSLQHRHHSPVSSSSAFIGVVLLATSLVYVLLSGTWFILYYVYWWTQHPAADLSSPTRVALQKVYLVAEEAHCFVFSGAFYVYLVRGKQFRAELYKLICRCAAAAADDDNTSSRVSRRCYADSVV